MNNEHIDVVWKALENHCRDNMTDDEWDDLCYSMAIIEESMRSNDRGQNVMEIFDPFSLLESLI